MADKDPKTPGNGGVIVLDVATSFSLEMKPDNAVANGIAQNRARACFSNSGDPIGNIPIIYEITQGNAVFAGGLKRVETTMNAIDCDSIAFTDTTAETGKIRATLKFLSSNTQEIEYTFISSVVPYLLTLTVTQNNALANGTAANTISALLTQDGKPAAGKRLTFTLSGSATARFAGGATSLSVITGADGRALISIVNSSQKDEGVTVRGVVDENTAITQSVVVNFKGLAQAPVPGFTLVALKGSAVSNGTDFASVSALIVPAVGSAAQTYRVEFNVTKNLPVNPGNFTIGAISGAHPSAQYIATVNVSGPTTSDAAVFNSDVFATIDAAALVTARLIDASGKVIATSDVVSLVFKSNVAGQDNVAIDLIDTEGGLKPRVSNGVFYYICGFEITNNGVPYNGVFTVSVPSQSTSSLSLGNPGNTSRSVAITAKRSDYVASGSILTNFRSYMGAVVRDSSSQAVTTVVTVTVVLNGRTYSKSLPFRWLSVNAPTTPLPPTSFNTTTPILTLRGVVPSMRNANLVYINIDNNVSLTDPLLFVTGRIYDFSDDVGGRADNANSLSTKAPKGLITIIDRNLSTSTPNTDSLNIYYKGVNIWSGTMSILAGEYKRR